VSGRARAWLLFTALASLATPWPSAHAGVATTKHNLSASGSGVIKAVSETQICIFCHTPHSGAPNTPLWNRRSPGSTYLPYTSSTLKAAPGQPTGASLMCLSCHDGTIALGDVLSRATPIAMSGGVTTLPSGASRLGTDLSDDHPVSFVYSAALAASRGELVDPATLTGRVRLDSGGRLQCTACHDPHDDANGQFLVMSNQASALCQACHVKNYWATSDHRNSSAVWNGTPPNPWPHTQASTVAANACESCHRPHTAGGRLRLLNEPTEEANCYTCHNANVALRNVQSEFNKLSIHPVASTTGVHDPSEPAVVQSRHVECVDCHNPHAARAGAGSPTGPLEGVRGISLSGGDIDPVTAEYQICFRCHADSSNRPAPYTSRQLAQSNTRLEFDTASPSFHPVAGPGRNANVPSLIAPLTTTSVIRCSDCHGNNAGPGAGGTGPAGPHGSTFRPLLERQYVTTDNTSESASAYALCYKCHSRTSILNDASFGEHRKHIDGERTPCNVCHDPHGITASQGNSVNNGKLINFDLSAVSANSSGQLRFESTGTFRGRCYLSCHGKNHNPESY